MEGKDVNYVSHLKRKKNKIIQSILVILLTLTIIQQMPIVKDTVYSEIRSILYLCFGGLALYNIFPLTNIIKTNFHRLFFITVLYSIFLSIITSYFGDSKLSIFELIIPFIIYLISYNIEFSKGQLNKLLIFYIILNVFLGISSIFYYGNGFNITQSYFLEFKNQIGPLIGGATVIVLVWLLNKKEFTINLPIILNLIFLFALASSIVIIRNRASLVGIFIVLMLLLIFKKYIISFKTILIFYISISIILILLLTGQVASITNILLESFILNYEVDDINSISAGRTDVYIQAIRFSLNYPILGELGENQRYITSTPHNYILNKWVKYGIGGSLPIITFYLYLWWFVIKEFYKQNQKKMEMSLPIWLLLFALVISLFEYTYPYGPGVSQVMVWFLIGQYMKRNIENLT